MALALFPARASIARVTLPDGSTADALMTPEFARALANVFGLLGGDAGVSITEVLTNVSHRSLVLAQSAVPVVLSNTLIQTVMATIAVPPKLMGLNGMLRISTTWSVTNNERNKTFITKFAGVNISLNVVTTTTTYREQQTIQNRNNVGSQVFVLGGFGNTGAPIGTMSKNTDVEQIIQIAAQLSNLADIITLEAYTVELIPSP